MHLLVIDNGSLTTHLIARRAVGLGWRATIVHHTSLTSRRSAARWDAVVTSGTAVPVTSGRFDDQLQFIRECSAPLLGICGGMHLIARAYQTGIAPQDPIVGRTVVSLDRSAPLFAGLPRTVELFQRHRYRVSDVPAAFRRIATSRSCPTEAIAHRTRPLYGIQAHVELRPDGERILRRFLAAAGGSTHGSQGDADA